VVQGRSGKEGIYRGQCAALCGRDHASCPLSWIVRTPDDFKKWVDAQKAAVKQAALPAAPCCRGSGTAAHRASFAELTQLFFKRVSDYGPMFTRAHAHHPDHAVDGHHDQPVTGIKLAIRTNHKDIGTMYLVFSLIMFFIGGAWPC